MPIYPLPEITGDLTIDVSHWEGVIDWPKAHVAGVRRAVVKLTDGCNFGDPLGGYNARRCREMEPAIRVGFYHYMRPAESAVEQMRVFEAALYGAHHALGEAAILDCESTGGVVGYKVRAHFLICYRRLLADLQLIPEVYTRLGWWRDVIGRIDWTAEGLPVPPLWAADYGWNGKGSPLWTAKPPGPRGLPYAPTWSRWRRWQYTDQGIVPGIPGKVDLNVEAAG